jgi:putative transposase
VFSHNALKQKENQAMAHSTTIFSQLLQLVSKHDFKRIEQAGFKLGRKPRSLTRWGQFVAMMFAHVSGRSSLRDIASQLGAQARRLYHLGVKGVKRSTLSDANNDRPAEFFESVFHHLYAKCSAVAPKKRFRFKCKLYSFDSTVVDLCLELFPWARFRKNKGGIKLHTLLDHDGHIPAFVQVTDAKTPDIAVARLLNLPPGSITVFDRAYIDFSWFGSLNEKDQFFVTRMKRNISYKVVERHEVDCSKGLTSDQVIVLTGAKAKECSIQLRRIGYRDPQTGKHYVFLTNIRHLVAKTICEIYHDRWQIELFFKWIKQNLKIKTFFGTSRNAVLTQVWIALVTLLLLAFYKFKAKLGQSLTQILKLLQLTLFSRRNLWELLHPVLSVQNTQIGAQLCIDFNSL